ncbi:LacI family DNA-binding transcriptional regulator [Streptomyces sp. KMM 9044]|uniref:LacI family DNA-binding transcriptional regulator n=1 Tax=Streptomyces sp. KMM 9044 TaxID=2744474 RepID=UPI0021515ED1|nr:LacI family DNA-binding transcriptional regulator [Streptomyces sp. KMM 9044]WAX78635.1 LacI family DNA-binding transcriptional regulator [Streptomyces sp. KMM 9044]
MSALDSRSGSGATPRRTRAAEPEPASVTLQDVATEAGVSLATASRALNGGSRGVRPENLARVRDAAARLGYVPNASAQATAKGSTQTVALVVSDVADPYYSAVAAGITDAAEANGLVVTMTVADRSPRRELELARGLRGHRPQIIVIAGSRINDSETEQELIDELAQYRATGGRVVLISQPGLPFPTVTVDDTHGAEMLARTMVQAGYRRYAIICGPDRIKTSLDRCKGFTTGLRASGIETDEQILIRTRFTRSGGYDAARELVERGLGDIELIFAVSDTMAIGVMTALRDAGLEPGRDIAVAGFDDISSASDVVPALTTVAVPLREAGSEAVRLGLSGEEAHPVHIPTTVHVRESTPRAPASGRSPTGPSV